MTAIKVAAVLLPGYAAAYLTDKMVWVVPTLAASGLLAASLKPDEAEAANVETTPTQPVDQSALRRRNEDDIETEDAHQDYQGEYESSLTDGG